MEIASNRTRLFEDTLPGLGTAGRGKHRMGFNARARCWTSDLKQSPIWGKTEEIALNGLLICSDSTPPLGAEVKLRLSTLTTVNWCSLPRWSIGSTASASAAASWTWTSNSGWPSGSSGQSRTQGWRRRAIREDTRFWRQPGGHGDRRVSDTLPTDLAKTPHS